MKQSQSGIKKRTVKHLAKQYFKKNKGRNLAGMLAIALTAFLFTAVTSLTFHMADSLQLSQQMQKGSKGDGSLGYMSREQYEQLLESDMIKEAGSRMPLTYATNASGHAVEINYADAIQQELTFCTPTQGRAPEASNEIATTELALKALGVEPKIGASVPVEFELRGEQYHFDMVLSGWWEASNDMVSMMLISRAFVQEHPELFAYTYDRDRETAGTYFSDVILKDQTDIKGQLQEFVRKAGGEPEDMSAANFVLCTENQMSKGMLQSDTIVLAVLCLLLFIVCGYLLIYNIFDISVMQDVRQYGLLRTIGMSARQIKTMVNRQALRLTLIGLPIGLIFGSLAGRQLLPVVMELFRDSNMTAIKISLSPMILILSAAFTAFTVYVSTRKPAKKAAGISPLEAAGYTEQRVGKKAAVHRRRGGRLSRMAFSNLGRNKRRSVFIVISLLLCIVLMNSMMIVSKSVDEEKAISRRTRTEFTCFNSVALQVLTGFKYHKDGLPQAAVEAILKQPGVEKERYLYRNTRDDGSVLVDYGLAGRGEDRIYEFDGIYSKAYQGYVMNMPKETDEYVFGNVCGVSEHFLEDMDIFAGEEDKELLKEKMENGDYVILGCHLDALTGEPEETPLTEEIQVGDQISFYKDGELFKTCTVLARANVLGTETELANVITAQERIGGDAPFLYLSEKLFRQIYEHPTLLNLGFDVAEGQEENMEEFLKQYTEQNPDTAYSSVKLMREQMDSIRKMILAVGGLVGGILAFAGLINFTNLMITSILSRRHEFAAMRSIGMTKRQLRRLVVYEGLYYAAAADLFGLLAAGIFGLTVLKGALNSPSMWFFTLRFTLVPAVAIGALYLILAAAIPVIALRFFDRGTVAERLRETE